MLELAAAAEVGRHPEGRSCSSPYVCTFCNSGGSNSSAISLPSAERRAQHSQSPRRCASEAAQKYSGAGEAGLVCRPNLACVLRECE